MEIALLKYFVAAGFAQKDRFWSDGKISLLVVDIGWDLDLKLYFWDYKLNASDYLLMVGSLHILIEGGCWGLSACHTFHPFQKCERSGPAGACFAWDEFLPAGIFETVIHHCNFKPSGADELSCVFPTVKWHITILSQGIFQELLQLVFANLRHDFNFSSAVHLMGHWLPVVVWEHFQTVNAECLCNMC